MKLTKGMKKALSLLLSAAMVVTGVNVTTNTASAAKTETETVDVMSWEGTASIEKVQGSDQGWGYAEAYTATVDTTKTTAVSEAAFSVWKSEPVQDWWGGLNVNYEDDLSVYEEVTVTVAGNATTGSAFYCNYGEAKDEQKTVEVAKGDFSKKIVFTPTEESYISVGMTNASADVLTLTEIKVTATQVKKVEETTAPTEAATNSAASGSATKAPTGAATKAPTGAATEAPTEEPTKAPAKPTATPMEVKGHEAFLMFTDKNWGWGNWNAKNDGGIGEDADVTGNGTYTVSLSADAFAEDPGVAEGATVFCVDIVGLANSDKIDTSDMKISDVVVKADDKEIKDTEFNYFVGNIEKEKSDIRIEIRNEYGLSTINDDETPFLTKDNEVFDDLSVADTLSVTFTVSGCKEGATPANRWNSENGVVRLQSTAKGETTIFDTGAAPAETAPAATATATGSATSGPAVTTGSSIATKTAVSGAAATSKIKVAKSKVVIAPGKSTNVKFTVSVPAAASKAAVVKVTTKSKKVATAKISGKKVKISVPKKAVKGASTTITLKSTKLNGKACSATIKVFVQNKAKKIAAAKKSITIKKGKKAKLTIKVKKAENKKKAVTDTVKVTSKVAKLVSTKASKGKIVLTLKGKKKGSQKATIKVGSKKVKVNVKVK